MDDYAVPTPTWLAFTLALPSAARVFRHLRSITGNTGEAAALIQRYVQYGDPALGDALSSYPKPVDLAQLTHTDNQARVERALEWASRSAQHTLLGLDHALYPALLRQTDFPPPLLYLQGATDALNLPLLAAVGSRKASHGAITFTRSVCAELSSCGLGIVSGLALGVDAAAHRGALDVNGVTIAVAATAPDTIYPRQHTKLAAQILAEGGLIITEHALGTATRPWFFPQRNRIISGLSLGVIVAEASLPSGTLTTATHAMNQGREVMAVPGSVHNLQSRGCHELIKQGASLIENTQDILDSMRDVLRQSLRTASTEAQKPVAPARPSGLAGHQSQLDLQGANGTDLETTVLRLLSQQPATLDELVALSAACEPELSLSRLTSTLGHLEIKGFITTTAGGRYACC